ncbi:MAG TPA: DUF1338 family protein [Mariniphaga sp.]|nr:DUF1338 family protein [Mariniphaga sp.]
MKRNKTEIAANLIDKLWINFRIRVPYARIYFEMALRNRGQVVIDHIGFRSLNTQTGEQPSGINAIGHIFQQLGYKVCKQYKFQRKKLTAVHLVSENPELPKIFISQLEVSLLPQWVQDLFPEIVADTPYLLSDSGIELLGKLHVDGVLTHEAADILEGELVGYFQRPWDPPIKESVLKINDVNHYAAWVLLHGNAPSHFAALINEQHIDKWPDIKSTSLALYHAGIPVNRKIEGLHSSMLQQTATLAIKEDVTVKESGLYDEIPWTYGYLELIQRGSDNRNKGTLFQDFLEEHERQLYQMTMTLDN